MQPFIRVRFEGMAPDPSIEASIHRWVAQLESTSFPIHSASIVIEQAGRRRTAVRLKLELVDGSATTAATSHGDIYMAVADTFRTVRTPPRARPAPTARGRAVPGSPETPGRTSVRYAGDLL